MNKNIKRTIAIVLAIGAFSVLEPVKCSNIMIENAYANSDIYLKGISVTDGDDIKLTNSKKTYTTDVPTTSTEVVIRVTTNDKDDQVTIDGDNPEKQSDKKFKKTLTLDKGVNTFEIVVKDEDGENEREYTLKIDRGGKQSTDSESIFLDNINVDYGNVDFLKTTTSYDLNVDEDVTELRVQANPENNNYIIRIDGSKVDDDDKFRRVIKLTKGANAISIDIEDDEDDNNTKTYTLNVYRGKNPNQTGTTSTDTNVKFDEKQDEIYLDDIVLDDGDVKFTPNFNKKVTSYVTDVKETSEDVIVKGVPAEYSSIVKINGTTADEKNRKRISLSKGKNVIEIQVNTDCDNDDEDYEKRIYTLTVYRGTSEGSSATATTNNGQNIASSATNTNAAQNSTSSNAGKANQWINVNGKWQCNDSTGNPLRNTWYFDKNYGKTYYFKEDGNMATGWISYNATWYYLELDGSRVTGWKQLGANWYYLDGEGKMKTGWFKDINGKWYYLYNSSGIMATSTSLDGYRIGSDGAMI